jgi:hypothetical protein
MATHQTSNTSDVLLTPESCESVTELLGHTYDAILQELDN